MMQIYADVLGRPIQTVRETETTALGAAVMAAAAAGIYETPEEAVRHMTGGRGTVYTPDPQRLLPTRSSTGNTGGWRRISQRKIR